MIKKGTTAIICDRGEDTNWFAWGGGGEKLSDKGEGRTTEQLEERGES